jgi:hypothetical protein
MRNAAAAFLLIASACNNNENIIYGQIGSSSITPFVSFDNVNSVISGRLTLTDGNGAPTGTSTEVVIISDRTRLCDRLTQTRDYFRNPPEAYQALILFLPPDRRVGTFIPGRPGDEGTASEIIAVDPAKVQASIALTGNAVAPFVIYNAYPCCGGISLTDWSESAGGESSGNFYLYYAAPPELNNTNAFPFSGKFRSSVCATLDGTQLQMPQLR